MAGTLQGRAVAVLATDGVGQVEPAEPVRALKQAGAEVHVIAPGADAIQRWNHFDKADRIPADPAAHAALPLPGGVINPDRLRLRPKAIAFIRHFVQAGRPIAALGHGPRTLIDAGGVAGRRVTSWPSLRTDLANAGAPWVDEAVVTDRGLVTSRAAG